MYNKKSILTQISNIRRSIIKETKVKFFNILNFGKKIFSMTPKFAEKNYMTIIYACRR